MKPITTYVEIAEDGEDNVILAEHNNEDYIVHIPSSVKTFAEEFPYHLEAAKTLRSKLNIDLPMIYTEYGDGYVWVFIDKEPV